MQFIIMEFGNFSYLDETKNSFQKIGCVNWSWPNFFVWATKIELNRLFLCITVNHRFTERNRYRTFGFVFRFETLFCIKMCFFKALKYYLKTSPPNTTMPRKNTEWAFRRCRILSIKSEFAVWVFFSKFLTELQLQFNRQYLKFRGNIFLTLLKN